MDGSASRSTTYTPRVVSLAKALLTTVNSLAWAPYELGPILACASSDGKISVINFQNDGSTDASVFPAHGTGANAISWAPSVLSSTQPISQKRFVSGGSDNLVRIWLYDEEAKKWGEEEVIRGHEDWVRDVSWAPNIGLPGMYIASASQVSPDPAALTPGPHSAHPLPPLPYLAMDFHSPPPHARLKRSTLPGRGMARVMESCWKHPGGVVW